MDFGGGFASNKLYYLHGVLIMEDVNTFHCQFVVQYVHVTSNILVSLLI